MASKNSREQSVQFSVNWTIKLSEFDELSWPILNKVFVTSSNNVPLVWKAKLTLPTSHFPGIGFFLYYLNGPIEILNNMEYEVSLMKPDFSIPVTTRKASYDANRCTGWGSNECFNDNDPVAIRAKYALKESDPLLIRIKMKIPAIVFSYTPTASPLIGSPKWMTDLFANIQDPEKSVFWNAKLISRDGAIFYCHKVIAYQSDVLEAKFRSLPPAGQPENEYGFEELSSKSLKVLLQYLYTGQVDLADLDDRWATDLIEVAEAAKTYKLKFLEEACLVLWKKVVENPFTCPEILRFANLHKDLKDLKYRAMDVLAENYEMVSARSEDMFGDGQRGVELREEFLLFISRRLSVEKNLAS